MKSTLFWLLMMIFSSASIPTLSKGAEEHFNVSPFIIGGSTALDGEFSYLVAIKLLDPSGDKFDCGGSIIGSKWILTAAHCAYIFIDSPIGRPAIVVTGTNNRIQGGVAYNVSHAYVHPGYNHTSKANDICLLELDKEIHFDHKTQPIGMAIKTPPENSTVTVVGWGYTDKNHQSQAILLQKLNTKTMNIHKCGELIQLPENDSPICTLSTKGQGICHGDSGGPLVLNHTLVGVASFVSKTGCADGIPDVFANVVHFRSWIHGITGNLFNNQTHKS